MFWPTAQMPYHIIVGHLTLRLFKVYMPQYKTAFDPLWLNKPVDTYAETTTTRGIGSGVVGTVNCIVSIKR